MKFTSEELLFFQEVTSAPVPFGIFLKFPSGKKGNQVGEETVATLQEKGVLDAQRKFTKWGMATLMLWEAYGKSERYLIINNSFLGLTKEGRVIHVQKESDGYEILSFDRAVFLHRLLRRCAFLCEESRMKELLPATDLAYEDWLREIESYGENLLVVGAYERRQECFQAVEEMVYYWRGKEGYRYDFGSAKVQSIRPIEMRHWFLDWTGLKQEVMQHGS